MLKPMLKLTGLLIEYAKEIKKTATCQLCVWLLFDVAIQVLDGGGVV